MLLLLLTLLAGSLNNLEMSHGPDAPAPSGCAEVY
jgi:hypothetical protein